MWIGGGLVCLAACKVEAPPVAEPVAETKVDNSTMSAPVAEAAPQNSAAEVLEYAEGLERVDLVRTVGDHEVVAAIDPVWVPRLKEQLVGAEVPDDLTNTPPSWELGVRLFVEGVETPFVGIPVGYDRLRLNPHDPWSPRIALDDGGIDPEIREVVVGDAFIEHIESLAFAANEPSAKEHGAPP